MLEFNRHWNGLSAIRSCRGADLRRNWEWSHFSAIYVGICIIKNKCTVYIYGKSAPTVCNSVTFAAP